ncbi:tRNA selenocysteine 1-associated protein 1 isoform X1 [Pseudophryne corroboree]|uniref:tRNA selenocysteine 1-associated protein 1 isoform X1 n=1 Tax=Pseudophryne corroboree TaxID=495146 RepID=UPI003081CB5E
MASLWMGDVDENMSESFIMQAFQVMGETAQNVKIIRNRFTGALSGYCFVEVHDQAAASRCLINMNGKLIPNSNPPKRFKLKHALYTKPTDPSSVPPALSDDPCSTHSAEAEAVAQLPPVTNQATDYVQAFNYYSQQFQQMFSNWKYDDKYNSYSFQQYGYTANDWQAPEGFAEEAVEDPNPPVDVNEANKEFMEQSEELYDALMNCPWQPLNSVTSKIPSES